MSRIFSASDLNVFSLDAIESSLIEFLNAWFSREDYIEQATFVFGATASSARWQEQAETLRENILSQNYNIRLELRTATELNGAMGAYSATGTTRQPTIYLNSNWLNTATSEQITAVLLEELGHDFDHRLNGNSDSLGDEGEIFANLVLGKSFDL